MKNRLAFIILFFLFLASLPQIVFAVCGNSQCEDGENACSCPSDCGSCSGEVSNRSCATYYCTEEKICAIEIIPNCCGNDWCEESGSYAESFGNCPTDCQPTEVNLSILSPESGSKIRYGEETLYKVRADANGRSIAGITVKVNGPFETFELSNDGLHDDNAFNDNILAAYNKIAAGIESGFYDINFFTSFRGIDGNSSVIIELYPFIDVDLVLPAETELGNMITANAKFSINEKPVNANIHISLENETGETVAEKSMESDDTGEIIFEYRTTFIDKPGKWIFRITGNDEYGNSFDLNRIIAVVELGNIPERKLLLSKTLNDSYEAGENILLVVNLTENGAPLENVIVRAELNKTKVELKHIGGNEYAGSIKVERVREQDENIVVKVFNAGGGLIAQKSFSVKLRLGELLIEVLEPKEKLYEQGQRIEFKIVVVNSANELETGLEPYVIFNSKKIFLKEQNSGVYSGTYVLGEGDFGEVLANFFSESDGVKGEKSVSFFVTEKTLFSETEQKIPEIFFAIAIIFGIGMAAYVYQGKINMKTGRHERLGELEELEKTAQTKYFREKTINKKEYNELMEKYSKERRELK